MKEEKFIHFTIAPYCLPKLLLAFYNNGIHDFAISQQDDDLIVGISVDYLKKIVYPKMKDLKDCLNPMECKGETND
jgi:hypothetical protein